VDTGTFHLSYSRFQSKIYHRSCLFLLVKYLLSPSLLVAVAGLSLAASPVATVSSAGSFALRGATVKTDGVPSWPVMAGDEIKTSVASAVIQFRDGSRVTLGAASTLRVEQTVSNLNVRLSSGSMEVLSRSSALQVYQNSMPVNVIPGKLTKVNTSSVTKDVTSTDFKAEPRPRPIPISSR
jgi:hypothetical protein